MNQQNQGSRFSNPYPGKRKRGRPRKDERIVQVEPLRCFPDIVIKPNQPGGTTGSNIAINPNQPGGTTGSNIAINPNQAAGTTGSANDEMVGRVVTGVIEGGFGGGYFLKVQIGDPPTYFRGVVFRPGQCVPITPENDVVPHLEMIKRANFPIPVLNPQAQIQSFPSSGQGSRQAVEPQPPVKDQVPPTEIHSGASSSLKNQSAYVQAPMTNVPTSDSPIFVGGIPQISSDPGQGSRSASVQAPMTNIPTSDLPISTRRIPQISSDLGQGSQSASTTKMECDRIVQQDTSRQVKEPSADGGTEKDLKSTAEDTNLLPMTENIVKEPQTGQHSGSSVQLNEQVQDLPKISNFELNQMPAPVEPEPMQSEQIQDKPMNSNIELNEMPVSAEPKAMQSEQIHEPRNTNLELNKMPVSHDPENVQSVDKLGDKADFPKPAHGDVANSESRFGSDRPDLLEMSYPQKQGPSDSGETTEDVAIQPLGNNKVSGT
ncbi:hypothetical protein QN277_028961 [Acacia crassicarpa]|uniref:AT hook motif-containing protein n=1 Tax=Acacia crassicarpa TaxID=499986 RepID=A0AAE1J605_9FABA|nr:hypothetical protein QN277_028961 [Acacia crassicarpa]